MPRLNRIDVRERRGHSRLAAGLAALALLLVLALARADVAPALPGDVYVLDRGANALIKVGPGAAQRKLPVLGVAGLRAVEIGAGGTIYVSGGSGVYRVDPLTGVATAFSTAPIIDPRDMVVTTAGDLYVLGFDTVYRVNGVTGETTTLGEPLGAETAPWLAIAIDPDAPGGTMEAWAQAFPFGALYTLDQATGARSIRTTGGIFGRNGTVLGPRAAALAFSPEGDRYVASGRGTRRNDGILDGVFGARPRFSEPDGIAIESGGKLLVIDAGTSAADATLYRVDPVTRAVTVVTAGGSLRAPTDVAIDRCVTCAEVPLAGRRQGPVTPIEIALRAPRSLRLANAGAIRLDLSCNRACRATVTARVRIAASRRRGKVSWLRLRTLTRSLPAGRPRTLVVALPPRTRALIRRALVARRGVSARVRVRARDAAGAPAAQDLRITLRR